MALTSRLARETQSFEGKVLAVLACWGLCSSKFFLQEALFGRNTSRSGVKTRGSRHVLVLTNRLLFAAKGEAAAICLSCPLVSVRIACRDPAASPSILSTKSTTKPSAAHGLRSAIGVEAASMTPVACQLPKTIPEALELSPCSGRYRNRANQTSALLIWLEVPFAPPLSPICGARCQFRVRVGCCPRRAARAPCGGLRDTIDVGVRISRIVIRA